MERKKKDRRKEVKGEGMKEKSKRERKKEGR
jgi:hypothetical protein